MRAQLPARRLTNLVKRSAYQKPFFAGSDYDPNYPQQSCGQRFDDHALQNFRTWSVARWNKALLLPKENPPVTPTSRH